MPQACAGGMPTALGWRARLLPGTLPQDPKQVASHCQFHCVEEAVMIQEGWHRSHAALEHFQYLEQLIRLPQKCSRTIMAS